MKKNKFAHLDEEQKAIIRDVVYSGFSARQIGQEIGVEHTTITREVKRNKIVKIPKPRKASHSLCCKNILSAESKTMYVKNALHHTLFVKVALM